MTGNKKILFIAWDGPYVNYMEGLFIPIFKELKKSYAIHIIQFSWSDAARLARLTSLCKEYGITYTHQTVWVRPVPLIGKYLSLLRGAMFLARYIAKHSIDLVIPRSTMPAKIILFSRVFFKNYQLVFDADGLPIEERVEFAGLKQDSLRYQSLKKAERRIFERADRILTRSSKAIQYLSSQHKIDPEKFAVVTNGRDEFFFKSSSLANAQALKKELNIPQEAFVLVYVGSLGPQYGVEQMFYIYQQMKKTYANIYLMLLTTNPEYLAPYKVTDDPNLVVKTVPQTDIPAFLSVADVGLAIRQSSPAMMGVAPIKLGEYLLMGLPVIASKGIGDTELSLSNHDCIHLLPDYSPDNLDKAVNWVISVYRSQDPTGLKQEARSLGTARFSLRKSVSEYHTVLDSLLSE